jgi:hypothetical protein
MEATLQLPFQPLLKQHFSGLSAAIEATFKLPLSHYKT